MGVIEFNTFKEKQKLVQELKEWQKRLNLAYEFDWKNPSKLICHREVERLRKLIDDDETILHKINKYL